MLGQERYFGKEQYDEIRRSHLKIILVITKISTTTTTMIIIITIIIYLPLKVLMAQSQWTEKCQTNKSFK